MLQMDCLTATPNTPTSPPVKDGTLPPIEDLSLGRHLSALPPELAALIVGHLYNLLLPPSEPFPSPDPRLQLVPSTNALAKPFFAPAPIEQAWESLRSLCLVNKTWGAFATRVLWRSVGFGMPKGFESILRTIREYQSGGRIARHGHTQDDAGGSAWSFRSEDSGVAEERGRRLSFFGVEEDKWSKMSGSGRKDGMMVDDPSVEDRVPRWSFLHKPASPTDFHLISTEPEPQVSPALNPLDSPLLHTKTISFSRFRTAGLRRSVRQSSHERFVTPHRLLLLLRGTRTGGPLIFPENHHEDDEDFNGTFSQADAEDETIVKGKLEAVGFTEFMDSALSRPVLEELLFRGGYLAEYEEDEEVDHGVHDEKIYGRSRFRSTLGQADGTSEFRTRQLQSSQSRSPGRDLMISDQIDETEERDELSDEEADREIEGVRGRPSHHAPRLERRPSGSAFALPDPSEAREHSEERGRELGPNMAGRGRLGRRGRSLLPPSAFTTRSVSVPAPFLQRTASLPRRLSVDPSERSSSVPASARGGEERQKKVTQVLEGSTATHAIRALDLCGCVSSTFVAGLAEFITANRLGPPTLFATSSSAIGTIVESDDDEGTTDGARSRSNSYTHSSSFVDDASRKLRRVFFPHLRRLGLASSLLPSPHLTALVLSFPFLTHLDLASTLTAPVLIKHLAIAGQHGPGGRAMRLKALSLARCRLMTGSALVGLFCGDCPPFTSMAGLGSDEEEDTSWGSGEVVGELIDLSLFGDGTYPNPMSTPELKLLLTISPAFLSGQLRSLDLSSAPLTDALLLDHFPSLPRLIELGLAHCRNITLGAVATLLEEKTPGVEVLDLAHSCPAPVVRVISAQRRAAIPQSALSIMDMHSLLLKRVASLQHSSYDPEEAAEDVKRRKTNLRVLELDEKTLEAVQGGAGDWKVIWGKGRRGWYVEFCSSQCCFTIFG